MNNPILVLITSGKWDEVISLAIKIFDDKEKAKEYCKLVTTGKD